MAEYAVKELARAGESGDQLADRHQSWFQPMAAQADDALFRDGHDPIDLEGLTYAARSTALWSTILQARWRWQRLADAPLDTCRALPRSTLDLLGGY